MRDPVGAFESPPPDFELIDDALGLQTAATLTTPLELAPQEDADATGGRFANWFARRSGEKTEILVSYGSAGGHRVRAAVWWGNTGGSNPSQHFIIGPCSADSRWNVFAGGITVSEPTCLRLAFRTERVEGSFLVPVGTWCSPTPD